MPQRPVFLAVIILVMVMIVVAIWRYAGPSTSTPESSPVEGASRKPGAPPAPQTPAERIASLPSSHAIPNELGLKPGEVAPGTRPDTIIVQPLQPGPPKEILRTYTAPTPEDDPRIDRLDDGRIVFNEPVALARQLHLPDTSPIKDLDILQAILAYYRHVYRANPVGENNSALIRTLTGTNEHQVVVFPDDHPDLDARGQLLDRWGSPYYFHALSNVEMEIWSGGPDGRRGTDDDLLIESGESEALQLNADTD